MAPDTHCLFEPRGFDPAPPLPANILAKVLVGYNRNVDPTGFLAFDRLLFLTRDPRDTLVSRVLYDIYNETTICADDSKVNAFVALLRRKEADPAGTPLKDIIDVFDRMSRAARDCRARCAMPASRSTFSASTRTCVCTVRISGTARTTRRSSRILASHLARAGHGSCRIHTGRAHEAGRELAPLADGGRCRILRAVVYALSEVQRLLRGLDAWHQTQHSPGALFGLRLEARHRTPEHSRVMRDADGRRRPRCRTAATSARRGQVARHDVLDTTASSAALASRSLASAVTSARCSWLTVTGVSVSRIHARRSITRVTS